MMNDDDDDDDAHANGHNNTDSGYPILSSFRSITIMSVRAFPPERHSSFSLMTNNLTPITSRYAVMKGLVLEYRWKTGV